MYKFENGTEYVDTEHDKLVRLEANIGARLRDGHVNVGDLVDWWTRILGKRIEDVGWNFAEEAHWRKNWESDSGDKA